MVAQRGGAVILADEFFKRNFFRPFLSYRQGDTLGQKETIAENRDRLLLTIAVISRLGHDLEHDRA